MYNSCFQKKYRRGLHLSLRSVTTSLQHLRSRAVSRPKCSELMGLERYGRVRGHEVGVTPIQLSEVSRYTQHAAVDAQDSRVRRLEVEIQEIRQSRAAEMEEMR